jgi:hypothetical protein
LSAPEIRKHYEPLYHQVILFLEKIIPSKKKN